MDELLTLLSIALLAILLGYLVREPPIQRVRMRGKTEPLHAAGRRVRRAFEVLARATLERGNRVELLATGDELFARLLADLRQATTLITWQVFWFKPGHLAEEVADALIERAQAGVEILVLLDYFGSKRLGRDYVSRLRARGVNVQMFRPLRWRSLYKLPHRSHVRSVVIDGRIGYTGGFGIDDQWLGTGRVAGSWRDTHVRIEGSVVDQLQAPFISNWAECTRELLMGERVMEADAVASGDSQRAAILYSSPSLGSTSAERFLALTIEAARETLYITSAYFVPNGGFRHLLCAAAERGVDVRVLTPGANTDHISTWYASRARYEELLHAGVRIFEHQPTMIHAKTLVVDQVWSCVGSLNFDNRSLKLNDEVTLVAQDEQLGLELHQLFLRDLNFAREIELPHFEQRSWSQRAREKAARLLAPLL